MQTVEAHPIQTELPPGGGSLWLYPDPDTRLCPSLAAHLVGVSVMTFYRSWLGRLVRNVAGPGRQRRVFLVDLQRVTGKVFTVLDLHEASRRRGMYLAAQARSRKAVRP
jgi:hypothetical protein